MPGATGGTPTAMAPANPPAFAPTPAPGRLAVTLTGDVVSEVWVVPAAGGPGVSPELVDGAFSLGLAAGDYDLELVVGGKRLRTTKPIAVSGGAERVLTARVADGTITLEESVPLEDTTPSPSPGPSASPSATP
jgi:hypothetical protein